MSDSPYEPQHSAVEPPSEGPDGDERRHRIVLLGGLAGVVVLLLAGYLLFLRGGSSDDQGGTVPSAAHRSRSTSATAAGPAATPTPTVIPKTYRADIGRDPFKPLVVAATGSGQPAPAPAGSPATVTGGGNTTTDLGGGTTTSPNPAQSPVPGPSALPTDGSVTPVWIELDSQNGTKSATFFVYQSNGEVWAYTNVPAPTSAGRPVAFGNVFALLGLSDGGAVVQMGDGKPFVLQQGYANRHMLV